MRFALFPHYLDDGYIVWLEKYKVDQTFISSIGWVSESRFNKDGKGAVERQRERETTALDIDMMLADMDETDGTGVSER